MTRGSGNTPPWLPARGGKSVDADAVGGERHARANRLEHRAVAADCERRCYIANRALRFDPVEQLRGARRPKRDEHGGDTDHDQKFEQCEPFVHAPFIRAAVSRLTIQKAR